MQSSLPATLVPAVAGQPLRIGFVGRLAPTKGLESLIDALLGLGRRDWTLAIAGRGEQHYEAALKRRYESAQVRFLGFVDPGELYAGIDVLAVPSLWEEPLATVILEAYSYGVPVLAARRGGLPELVEHEKTGLVYEPETEPGTEPEPGQPGRRPGTSAGPSGVAAADAPGVAAAAKLYRD